jgi:hypothetical protein
MMFPVEEVCGDKRMIDKYPSASLYLAFLVIIHGALGFSQGYLQGSRNLRKGKEGSSWRLFRCPQLNGGCE